MFPTGIDNLRQTQIHLQFGGTVSVDFEVQQGHWIVGQPHGFGTFCFGAGIGPLNRKRIDSYHVSSSSHFVHISIASCCFVVGRSTIFLVSSQCCLNYKLDSFLSLGEFSFEKIKNRLHFQCAYQTYHNLMRIHTIFFAVQPHTSGLL